MWKQRPHGAVQHLLGTDLQRPSVCCFQDEWWQLLSAFLFVPWAIQQWEIWLWRRRLLYCCNVRGIGLQSRAPWFRYYDFFEMEWFIESNSHLFWIISFQYAVIFVSKSRHPTFSISERQNQTQSQILFYVFPTKISFLWMFWFEICQRDSTRFNANMVVTSLSRRKCSMFDQTLFHRLATPCFVQ